jgi:hypothetical protein
MITLPVNLARRSFLGTGGVGVGAMALSSLLGTAAAGDAAASVTRWPGTLQPLHHVPRAKRVIWLYMAGGMTHIDTWDNKPKLAELHGQPMPESVTQGQQIAAAAGPASELFRTAASVQTVGTVGPVVCGDLAKTGSCLCG